MASLAGLPKDWRVRGQFTRKVYTTVYPAIDPTKAENSLKGKTVVVTGASRAIGAQGIAPAFVKAGVKTIVLVDTKAERLAAVEEQLKKINSDVETFAVGADVTSADQVNTAWNEINAKYPKVDILVNNAGVETPGIDMTQEHDPDIFFRNFQVNVKGTHMMTQQYLKTAVSWATKADPAKIINMTNSAAWGVWTILAGYSLSKAAMIQYNTVIAASHPGTVLSIAVNPGLNDTEMDPASLREAGFRYNDPMLTGATLVWLTADPARSQFLNGRVLTAEWDVEDLVARKEEITSKNLLTMQLNTGS
ncbi:NAD(P)-binding protein [Hypoxylon sp. FL1150]|nr:NAD(P)-binding protein [Hypoxylon sp. FL1150]